MREQEPEEPSFELDQGQARLNWPLTDTPSLIEETDAKLARGIVS